MCPEVRPFKPLKFKDNRTSSLSPPFDTISGEQEMRLKSNPYNITHLTLPDEGGPEEARNKLDQWLESNVLVPEDQDSVIVVKQKFSFENNEMTRLGIISLVRINPDDGSIKPHEKTFESSVNGRVSIMSRLRSQLEPIFLTVDCDTMEPILEDAIDVQQPDLTYSDDEGTVHNIYTVRDQSRIAKLQSALSSKTFLVADGHHRLEATRRLSSESEGGQREFWNYVMAYITPIKEQGLVIAGIHRLVKKSMKLGQFAVEASKFFELNETSYPKDSKHMVVYDGKYTELVPKEEEIRNELGISGEEPLVHAEMLNDIFFARTLNLSPHDLEYSVSYIHDVEEARKEVDSGKAGMVVIMPKWSKEEFLRAISNGKHLPQKSTYFFPKVLSGIAINAYLGE